MEDPSGGNLVSVTLDQQTWEARLRSDGGGTSLSSWQRVAPFLTSGQKLQVNFNGRTWVDVVVSSTTDIGRMQVCRITLPGTDEPKPAGGGELANRRASTRIRLPRTSVEIIDPEAVSAADPTARQSAWGQLIDVSSGGCAVSHSALMARRQATTAARLLSFTLPGVGGITAIGGRVNSRLGGDGQVILGYRWADSTENVVPLAILADFVHEQSPVR